MILRPDLSKEERLELEMAHHDWQFATKYFYRRLLRATGDNPEELLDQKLEELNHADTC